MAKRYAQVYVAIGCVKRSVNHSNVCSTGSDRNLYTLRVYRSPPETTGDRLCVVVISLFQQVFFEVCTLNFIGTFSFYLVINCIVLVLKEV